MATTRIQTRRLDRSVARLDGKIVLPDHGGWNEARQAWNLAVDQRPAAVAFPESADDVIAVVELARAFGLRVAAQGTGHHASPLGDLSDTVLVKTERMRRVLVDAPAGTARIEAGVRSLELVEAAAAHGLAANSVHAVELVTADGRLVRADHDTEPDLFWALRGGGGDFGVVTALEVSLLPIRQVYAGILW